MKWSELEQQKRKELEFSQEKGKLITFCLVCAGICIAMLCITITLVCLKLQVTGGA